jgi:hypothetical protein
MSDRFDDFDVVDEAPADAETLIREALDLVATAKPMMSSSSIKVSRDEMLDLLEGALAALPEELRQARWLLREREVFMAEQQRQADLLMEDVKAQAERMVSRTELVRQAKDTARTIIEDAEDAARRMRHEAEDYCDQKLAGMEIVLHRVLKTVEAGRDKLKPTLEIVDPVDDEDLGDAEDFFDQDQR